MVACFYNLFLACALPRSVCQVGNGKHHSLICLGAWCCRQATVTRVAHDLMLRLLLCAWADKAGEALTAARPSACQMAMAHSPRLRVLPCPGGGGEARGGGLNQGFADFCPPARPTDRLPACVL
eukprot:365302-Chlamydomonas_euryale.AAC.2